MSADERINRIAREAYDYHQILIQIEKNKKYTENTSDDEVLNRMIQVIYKNAKDMADARKIYDQYSSMISETDRFLFNSYNVLELCKLRLEFISILSAKKQFLYPNFDDETQLIVHRFEEEHKYGFRQEEYVSLIQNTTKQLKNVNKF
jgi:hypothetical protein